MLLKYDEFEQVQFILFYGRAIRLKWRTEINLNI